MCDYCSSIELTDFIYTPVDYEYIVDYIKLLIAEQKFVLIDGNCELGHHKNDSGQWVDDVIYHTIKCPKCGQKFTCSVNTYRGGGSFTERL